MIKRNFTTVALATSVMFALQAAETQPIFQWGKVFDGPTSAGDQGTDIALAPNGDVYWMNTAGSNESTGLDINYDGQLLFNGGNYNTGSSYCNNLCIIKTDGNGSKLWTVYTNTSDFYSNNGGISVTSDGGVIFAAKVRHNDGMLTDPIRFVYQGGTYEIPWTAERRYASLVIGKISADGKVLWVRQYKLDTTPAPKASGTYADFTPDALHSVYVATDDADNIYVAGNYRNPFHFVDKNGKETLLTPHNTKSWTGDSQTVCGDMFVVKLDPDGYYLKSLTTTGEAGAEIIGDINWHRGNLYCAGYIVDGNGTQVSLGGNALSPSEVMSPTLFSLTQELEVNWVNCMPAEKVDGKMGWQNYSITVSGDVLWLATQFNLKITDIKTGVSLTSTQGAIREGGLLKFDARSGGLVKAVTSRTDFSTAPMNGLTGYLHVLVPPAEADKGKVYVFGYVMNTQVGAFIRTYDANTLAPDIDHCWSIVTGSGIPSVQTIVQEKTSNFIYSTVRSNKVFKPFGGSESIAPRNWGIYMSKFKLPGEGSGVTAPSQEKEVVNVRYYDYSGRAIAVTPDKGMYVKVEILSDGTSRSSKVVIR